MTKITTLAEYQAAASRTLPGEGMQQFFAGCYPRNTDLLHAVLGICTEAGELADPVKKAMFYGKPLDVANIKEEAGDLLWYLSGPLCRALNCTLRELAQGNIDKLRARYPEKFTEAAAIARADKT